MFIIKGKSVYGGVAIGKINVYNKKNQCVKRYHIYDIPEEIEDTAEDTDSEDVEVVADSYEPCLLSKSEAAVLSRYITQLLEIANESDYDTICGLADKLQR